MLDEATASDKYMHPKCICACVNKMNRPDGTLGHHCMETGVEKKSVSVREVKGGIGSNT